MGRLLSSVMSVYKAVSSPNDVTLTQLFRTVKNRSEKRLTPKDQSILL